MHTLGSLEYQQILFLPTEIPRVPPQRGALQRLTDPFVLSQEALDRIEKACGRNFKYNILRNPYRDMFRDIARIFKQLNKIRNSQGKKLDKALTKYKEFLNQQENKEEIVFIASRMEVVTTMNKANFRAFLSS